MFDFEKLNAYQKAKELHAIIFNILKKNSCDPFLKDQLKRAATSAVLNVAEGTGRFTRADKRNFYVIARGSVYECVAIADILLQEENIDKKDYQRFYAVAEELSKILLGLMQHLAK